MNTKKWEMVRLGDVGTIVTGNTPSTSNGNYYENNDIPFYKPSDLFDDTITVLDVAQTYLDKRAIPKLRILPKNSVLVTCIGTIGKVGITKTESATNQQINAIIVKEDICNFGYLAYAILRKKIYLQSIANAPVVPIINKKSFSNLQIPLPPLEEQKKIAKKLDSIQSLIAKREKQLEKMDLLVKAKFVEMFGDPVANPMEWEKSNIGLLLSTLTDFSANGSYEVLDSNVKMYDDPRFALMVRTTDLEKNCFDKNVKYIDEKAYNLLSKSKVYAGDIIMNKIGSAGRIFLMPELNIPVSLGRNAFLLRFSKKINNIFIHFVLASEYGQNLISKHIRGAVTKTITKDAVKSISVILPPINLQNQFADYVQQTEALKTTMYSGLEKLELLYNSKMQEYFG